MQNQASAIELDLDNQVVDVVEGKQVTRAEYAALFRRVQDARNWKNPIDAHVILVSERERILMSRAITFFTGSLAEFEVVRLEPNFSTYRVRAVGYYISIGA